MIDNDWPAEFRERCQRIQESLDQKRWGHARQLASDLEATMAGRQGLPAELLQWAPRKRAEAEAAERLGHVEASVVLDDSEGGLTRALERIDETLALCPDYPPARQKKIQYGLLLRQKRSARFLKDLNSDLDWLASQSVPAPEPDKLKQRLWGAAALIEKAKELDSTIDLGGQKELLEQLAELHHLPVARPTQDPEAERLRGTGTVLLTTVDKLLPILAVLDKDMHDATAVERGPLHALIENAHATAAELNACIAETQPRIQAAEAFVKAGVSNTLDAWLRRLSQAEDIVPVSLREEGSRLAAELADLADAPGNANVPKVLRSAEALAGRWREATRQNAAGLLSRLETIATGGALTQDDAASLRETVRRAGEGTDATGLRELAKQLDQLEAGAKQGAARSTLDAALAAVDRWRTDPPPTFKGRVPELEQLIAEAGALTEDDIAGLLAMSNKVEVLGREFEQGRTAWVTAFLEQRSQASAAIQQLVQRCRVMGESVPAELGEIERGLAALDPESAAPEGLESLLADRRRELEEARERIDVRWQQRFGERQGIGDELGRLVELLSGIGLLRAEDRSAAESWRSKLVDVTTPVTPAELESARELGGRLAALERGWLEQQKSEHRTLVERAEALRRAPDGVEQSTLTQLEQHTAAAATPPADYPAAIAALRDVIGRAERERQENRERAEQFGTLERSGRELLQTPWLGDSGELIEVKGSLDADGQRAAAALDAAVRAAIPARAALEQALSLGGEPAAGASSPLRERLEKLSAAVERAGDAATASSEAHRRALERLRAQSGQLGADLGGLEAAERQRVGEFRSALEDDTLADRPVELRRLHAAAAPLFGDIVRRREELARALASTVEAARRHLARWPRTGGMRFPPVRSQVRKELGEVREFMRVQTELPSPDVAALRQACDSATALKKQVGVNILPLLLGVVLAVAAGAGGWLTLAARTVELRPGPGEVLREITDSGGERLAASTTIRLGRGDYIAVFEPVLGAGAQARQTDVAFSIGFLDLPFGSKEVVSPTKHRKQMDALVDGLLDGVGSP